MSLEILKFNIAYLSNISQDVNTFPRVFTKKSKFFQLNLLNVALGQGVSYQPRMVSSDYLMRVRIGFSNQLRWGYEALGDPIFYMMMSLATAGWFFGRPNHQMAPSWIFIKAFFEEFFFRFLLQEALFRTIPHKYRIGPISLANLLASLCFMGMHMFKQPPEWAVMTLIPSLIFGFAWDRYKSILPCWIIHSSYNLVLYYRFF